MLEEMESSTLILPELTNTEITEVSETTEESTETSSFDPSLEEPNNSLLFWLFLLFVLVLIIICAITLLYCFKRKADKKDDLSNVGPIGGEDANLDQTSNISMRSQLGDKKQSKPKYWVRTICAIAYRFK